MPHCIIEYSHAIKTKPSALIDAVFQGALKSKLFEEDHIKTRTILYDHYQIGSNKEVEFIHVSAKILSGRTPEQLALLSQLILSKLKNLKLSSVVITVDVIEMSREYYAKAEV